MENIIFFFISERDDHGPEDLSILGNTLNSGDMGGVLFDRLDGPSLEVKLIQGHKT